MNDSAMELTLDEYRAINKKPSKFGNVRVAIDGYTFDSKAEAARYRDLKLMEQAGKISGLVIHPVYELQPGFARPGIRGKVRAIAYEADFAYTQGGRMVAEDVKGMETREFQIKYKLFLYRYPDIDLRIIPVTGTSRHAGRRRKKAA